MLIEIDGLEEFDRLEHRFDAWWPSRPLDLFGEALAEDTRLRLEDDETSPSGEKWDPWSDEYAKTRGPEHKLLFDTGALSRSFGDKRSGPALDFGSDLPYAKKNQKQRPYVGISREFSASLDGIFGADFERGW